MFDLFKNLGRAKAQQAGERVAELLASADPDAMTEAAILEVESHFRVVSEEVARAKADYQKEKKEVDAIAALQDRRMRAAEKLQADLTTDPGNTEVAAALEELLKLMEEAVPEIEREQREADDALELLEVLEENAKQMAEEMKNLRETANRAKRDMLKAEQEREAALRREDTAQRVAGIKQRSSSYSKAVEAMERAAGSARQEADAAQLRARLLAPAEREQNRLIEQAMAATNGETAPTGSSLTERLNRLKK
ncbi:MAG: hypothetical protein ACR2HF_05935 [Methylococcaceae bacterium]